MKKTFIYICIFLVGATFNHVLAQEKHETTLTKDISKTKDNHNSITIDPKLSSNKLASILQAGEDNPVKAEPITMDSKLNSEEQALILKAGEDNPVKAEPVGKDEKKPGDTGVAKGQVKDSEGNSTKSESGKADNVENSQPAGQVPSRITNYREINGSDTQPEGEQPGKITNYREMNGTNTQPEGKKPEKR